MVRYASNQPCKMPKLTVLFWQWNFPTVFHCCSFSFLFNAINFHAEASSLINKSVQPEWQKTATKFAWKIPNQSGGNVDGRMAIYNVTAVIRTILVKGFNCRRSHKLRKLLINENTRTNAPSSKIKLKNLPKEILKCLGHCITCDDDERRKCLNPKSG